MKMMFMHMMGGGAGASGGTVQGGFMGGMAFGAEDMKGMITEVVSALLPGMQQMLRNRRRVMTNWFKNSSSRTRKTNRL